jgi:NAD(P)H-quinone oxidoreductase subunit 4
VAIGVYEGSTNALAAELASQGAVAMGRLAALG